MHFVAGLLMSGLLISAPVGWERDDPSAHVDPKATSYHIRWNRFRDGEFQTFTLTVSPNSLSLDDLSTLVLKGFGRSIAHFHLVLEQNITLCHGAKAKEFVWTGAASPNNTNVYTDRSILTVAGDKAYVTSYHRGANASDDPGAIRALNSLCPPNTPRLAAYGNPPLTPPPGWMTSSMGPNYAASHPGGHTVWAWIGMPSGVAGPAQHIEATSYSSPLGTSVTADDVAAQMLDSFSAVGSDVTIVSKRPIALCGGAPGLAVSLTATLMNRPIDIEAVILPASPTSYTAAYFRMHEQPQDASAMKAIDSLCAHGSESAG